MIKFTYRAYPKTQNLLLKSHILSYQALLIVKTILNNSEN